MHMQDMREYVKAPPSFNTKNVTHFMNNMCQVIIKTLFLLFFFFGFISIISK